jgi:kumamolisin
MAIHDTTNKPSAISISWGNPEKNWSAQDMNSFDQAFQTAAALGVTICCAAGDAGSGDENPDQLAQFGAVPDGLAHADFPGSSPFVLCCGGTKLIGSGTAIASEGVWNEDPLRSALQAAALVIFSPSLRIKAQPASPCQQTPVATRAAVLLMSLGTRTRLRATSSASMDKSS